MAASSEDSWSRRVDVNGKQSGGWILSCQCPAGLKNVSRETKRAGPSRRSISRRILNRLYETGRGGSKAILSGCKRNHQPLRLHDACPDSQPFLGCKSSARHSNGEAPGPELIPTPVAHLQRRILDSPRQTTQEGDPLCPRLHHAHLAVRPKNGEGNRGQSAARSDIDDGRLCRHQPRKRETVVEVLVDQLLNAPRACQVDLLVPAKKLDEIGGDSSGHGVGKGERPCFRNDLSPGDGLLQHERTIHELVKPHRTRGVIPANCIALSGATRWPTLQASGFGSHRIHERCVALDADEG